MNMLEDMAKVWVIENDEVVETTLYDHIMESCPQVTSPRGCENKYWIRHNASYETDDKGNPINCSTWSVMDWGVQGKFLKTIETFDTEEQAKDALIDLVYNKEFLTDDQRNIVYYDTAFEAYEELLEDARYTLIMAPPSFYTVCKFEDLLLKSNLTQDIKNIQELKVGSILTIKRERLFTAIIRNV